MFIKELFQKIIMRNFQILNLVENLAVKYVNLL